MTSIDNLMTAFESLANNKDVVPERLQGLYQDLLTQCSAIVEGWNTDKIEKLETLVLVLRRENAGWLARAPLYHIVNQLSLTGDPPYRLQKLRDFLSEPAQSPYFSEVRDILAMSYGDVMAQADAIVFAETYETDIETIFESYIAPDLPIELEDEEHEAEVHLKSTA